MNLELYKIFYYAAYYKNLTRTAEALNVTQPTVTRSIRELESAAGYELFHRTKRGVTLTRAGETLFPSVKKLIEQAEEIDALLKEPDKLPARSVYIAASGNTIHHFLLPYIGAMRQNHPEIQIKISNSNTFQAIEQVKNAIADVAIVTSPIPRDDSLNVIKLAPVQDVAIAGNAYSALKGKQISPEELLKYPLIMLEKGSATREFTDEYFGSFRLRAEPDVNVAALDVIPELVSRNAGIGFVPVEFAKREQEKGTVFRLNLTPAFPLRYICLVTPRNKKLLPSVKLFIDLLEESV